MKNNPRLSKGHNERNHFKQRVLERFGLVVNRELYRAIVRAVQGQDVAGIRAHYIGAQSNRCRVFFIQIAEVEFYAVYDRNRREMITALPNRQAQEIFLRG